MRESEGSAKLVGEDSALPKFVTAVPFAPVYKIPTFNKKKILRR